MISTGWERPGIIPSHVAKKPLCGPSCGPSVCKRSKEPEIDEFERISGSFCDF